MQIGGETILTFAARALEPVGAWLGMDGAILLAFALSFPANELLLPVWVMIVSSGATLAQAQTADVGGLLLSSGWTMKTALCVMVFTLFHFPWQHDRSHHPKWKPGVPAGHCSDAASRRQSVCCSAGF